MLNFTPTIPADLPVTLQTLGDLISLLADPAASSRRVAEIANATADLRDATADLRAATEKSKAAEDALIIAQAAHLNILDQQASAAAEAQARQKGDFDTACNKRTADLNDREAALIALQTTAQDAVDAAAVARADYEKRVALIKSATG
jgi:hypothetical protein